MKGATGTNTSTIIDLRAKRNQWLRHCMSNCRKCDNFSDGYWCDKYEKEATRIMHEKDCRWLTIKGKLINIKPKKKRKK